MHWRIGRLTIAAVDEESTFATRTDTFLSCSPWDEKAILAHKEPAA
jgi:hypothetical protein